VGSDSPTEERRAGRAAIDRHGVAYSSIVERSSTTSLSAKTCFDSRAISSSEPGSFPT